MGSSIQHSKLIQVTGQHFRSLTPSANSSSLGGIRMILVRSTSSLIQRERAGAGGSSL